jgi:DNA ligase-1
MLKRWDAAYGQGRTKESAQGELWKWKLAPLTIDAVLVYAQRGHGRRAGLYTDYGFALWDDRQDPAVLVPFAKAYSGLTDAEIKKVDQVIRKTIEDKFGPVRQVSPSLVMELGFEAVMVSSRHKSGIAVRFPRILRLRPDKTIEQADRLSSLRAMLS